MSWRASTFGGARFWRMTEGDLHARVQLTPEGDYYWDVAIITVGHVNTLHLGRENGLKVAQNLAAGRLRLEQRKSACLSS